MLTSLKGTWQLQNRRGRKEVYKGAQVPSSGPNSKLQLKNKIDMNKTKRKKIF